MVIFNSYVELPECIIMDSYMPINMPRILFGSNDELQETHRKAVSPQPNARWALVVGNEDKGPDNSPPI